ncbi:AGE family epimerase/isomerase [Novosphingobium humi]|uniref:AGE family epimerase/isomerase n=1 Tax=Novosphingobium humi TaxID=2282397 RepID=A0ABY7TWV8_9SPHN|nr:AGE family epimerase/isomerase [Novosphingobium humi]WCT77370.1 AGE family epimerase/isomerase [Novosphingobium humi]
MNKDRPDHQSIAFAGTKGQGMYDWLTGPAAAIWLDRGVDRQRGGYYDSLSMGDAKNSSEFKRLRVTCRQIFVFSRLSTLGVSGAQDAMEHGINFLFDKLRHSEGGFVRSVTIDGQKLDERRDLYDLAFTVFALAAAFGRTRDTNLRDEALRILTFIQTQLWHEAGGYQEGLPPALPRRQNPHMHLLEACLAWLPLSAESAFRDVAQTILDLMSARFWSSDSECLFEYFEDDWQPCTNIDRRIFEPGHHFEWAWLLGECANAGLVVPDLSEKLARKAFQHGFSAQGLPYAEVRPDGSVADEFCRIWVITEWLRAQSTHCADFVPETRSEPGSAPLDKLQHFLNVPTKGLWFERCNAVSGQFVNEAVPASSLYHIVTGIDHLLELPQNYTH